MPRSGLFLIITALFFQAWGAMASTPPDPSPPKPLEIRLSQDSLRSLDESHSQVIDWVRMHGPAFPVVEVGDQREQDSAPKPLSGHVDESSLSALLIQAVDFARDV